MKKFFRNQKGINLISLTITVLVILVLTNVVIYNVKSNLKTQNIKALQTDISNLREKISTYYSQYGEIPANKEYTNTANINVISSAVDTGKFYVIDLSALDNITLNYGMDYEKIKSGEVTDVNTLSDLYIINKDSHNIFYVEGVTLDNQTFYTDYTTSDVDTEAVELKYVDGIQIPDGFYYVGGTKDTGIVISDVKGDDLDNSKNGNQFVWIPVENKKDYVRSTNYSNTYVAMNTTSDTNYLPDGIYNEEIAVINVGGFFVSRFEVGVERAGPVSKKGMTVDSYVTQERAKTRAKSIVNTDSAKSALCSGTQWDLVMKFVDGKEGYLVNTPIADRHNPNGIDKTGANEKDKVCNIYDLEGNVFEYVADKCNIDPEYNPCIKRGGSYDNYTTQASMYAACNGKENTSIGYRAVLYVMSNKVTRIYKDENGEYATIPGGFTVSEIPGERTIAKGLVIYDIPEPEISNVDWNTASTKYNQFVWIPVASEESYQRDFSYPSLYDSVMDTTPANSIFTDTGYLPTNIQPTTDNATDNETAEREAVLKYNGFYISRYEIGNEKEKPVSKQNTTIYVNKSQTDFKTIGKNMYGNSSAYVKSAMCSGIQWDMVMKFVDGKKDGNGNTYNVRKTDSARHTGNVAEAGNNFSDKVQNIYDLEGNCWEYVAEKNNTGRPFVCRGGYCHTASNDRASIRTIYYDNTDIFGTFRSVLYIK